MLKELVAPTQVTVLVPLLYMCVCIYIYISLKVPSTNFHPIPILLGILQFPATISSCVCEIPGAFPSQCHRCHRRAMERRLEIRQATGTNHLQGHQVLTVEGRQQGIQQHLTLSGRAGPREKIKGDAERTHGTHGSFFRELDHCGSVYGHGILVFCNYTRESVWD